MTHGQAAAGAHRARDSALALAGSHGNDPVAVGTTALDGRMDPLTLVARHGAIVDAGLASIPKHGSGPGANVAISVALRARSW